MKNKQTSDLTDKELEDEMYQDMETFAEAKENYRNSANAHSLATCGHIAPNFELVNVDTFSNYAEVTIRDANNKETVFMGTIAKQEVDI